MKEYLIGIFTALALVIAFEIANKPVDALIARLHSVLNENDQKMLERLLQYRVHRIFEWLFIIAIFLIGYGCRGVIGWDL